MHDRLYAIRSRWRAIVAHLPELPPVFYAHPFELAFGFVMFISGLRAFVSGESSPSINDTLPPAILTAFQLVSFLAGAAILAGLALRRHVFGRALERLGTILAAGTYAAYAVVLGRSLPLSLSWSTLTTVAAVSAAFYLRGRSIRKTELAILHALRASNTSTDTAELIRKLVDSRATDKDRESPS